jgi:co-chaperonin GroES (HSP10)
MAKDSLAQGARSAAFPAGHADRNDAIEFHGTVAAVEGDDLGLGKPGLGKAPTADEFKWQPRAEEPVRVVDFSKYQPMNDRVLLRRLDVKNENLVQRPEAYVQDSDTGEVIAVGDGMLIGGGVLRPIPLAPGDKVRFGHYNAEDIEVEGEQLVLVSAFDIRLKIRS